VIKPSKANIAASVRQRLLNMSRETDRPFNEVLQYFAMERFLYRLSQSAHEKKFILKGALTLVAWRVSVNRPTMDIDFLGMTDNRIESIVAVVQDICRQDVEPDGLVFDPASVEGERIVEDADYEGVRIRFRGTLETARIAMQLDIGFGDVIVPKPEVLDYPVILDLPAPSLRGYSRESVIAEKFEAMVKLGLLNSRVKDFFDIWLLSRQFDFQGSTLAQAITETFSNRGTAIPADPVAWSAAYAGNPARQTQWLGFVRRNRLQEIPTDFAEIVSVNTTFLRPVVSALAGGTDFQDEWHAPGPWRPHHDGRLK
jgi:predicted nucleotidyltransferase component of viral defense system